MTQQTTSRENADVVAAAQAGDEAAFTALVERYRRELQLHCYRMLGSYDDSEDLVQETFLRAWRRRATYQARSTFPRLALPDRDERLPRRPRVAQAAHPPAGGWSARRAGLAVR